MPRLLAFLTLLAMSLCAQSKSDPRDTLATISDTVLRGLASVEIPDIPEATDQIKIFTKAKVTSSMVTRELESVLIRYHIPASVVADTKYFMKDNVGALLLGTRTTGSPGDDGSILTLRLELQEAAILKRNPKLKVATLTWEDEQQIDAPAADSVNRFMSAIDDLGKRFALAFLSANRN
jgi:hypothetical protein